MARQELDEDLDLGIEKPASNKKLIILIAAGVLLLLLVGLGVGWWLLGGDEGGVEGEQATAEEAAEVKDQRPAIYLPLEPKFVVNLPPGGKAKMLQVGMQVMARNPDLIEFLENNDPMVRHNLLNLLSGQDSNQLITRKGKEKLQADVVKTLNKLVAERPELGEIEAVYFTSIVMQ